MPLPDERPRQSVANLIGKFEQGGKRGSSSNGAGVTRRQSQGVLSSVPPAMPLKAQYTGNSTSAISVQSGPRSPPIRASEFSNTSGMDVPSWRKATALQTTAPPAPEITQAEPTPISGNEPQETTPPTETEQKYTDEESTPASVPTEAEQTPSANESVTPKPGLEKSTKVSKPTSPASSSAAPKLKSVASKQSTSSTSKQFAPTASKTTKVPPVSRPSTLSKATASTPAKTARPSVIPPPAAPLKPQHTGGSVTANRLSAPTASSKARIAGTSSLSGAVKPVSSSASSIAKPTAPSSSTINRAATTPSTTTSPRKVVPKLTAMAGSAPAPVKKAPLPRSTVSTSKPSTSRTTMKKPTASASTTQKAVTTSKAAPTKTFAPPRVGLAGAGRVKNPSGPAKLAATGGLAAGVPTSVLLVSESKDASGAPTAPADKPQEGTEPSAEAAQKIEDFIASPEIEIETAQEGEDEAVMQESEPQEEVNDTHEGSEDYANQEEPALSETAGQEEEVELSGSISHDEIHEGEVSMTLDDDEHYEEESGNEVQEETPEETEIDEQDHTEAGIDHPEGGTGHEGMPEGHDQASASPPPSHTEGEPDGYASTPSEGEGGGGGNLEDVVALLEGGHSAKMAQPVDLFSPGYAESTGRDLTQESSPNPSQREVGDIPDDD